MDYSTINLWGPQAILHADHAGPNLGAISQLISQEVVAIEDMETCHGLLY